jgi:hypothetical protein
MATPSGTVPVSINTGNQKLQISKVVPTSSPFVQTFYIKATSEGNVINYQKLTVCICGAESVLTTKPSLSFLYIKNSGALSKQVPILIMN